MILVFHWTIDFFLVFNLKSNDLFDFRTDILRRANYHHPASIGRPVMQSDVLGVRQFYSI